MSKLPMIRPMGAYTPSVLRHARNLYDHMDGEAEDITLPDADEAVRVWTGATTATAVSMGVPTSAYSRVMYVLQHLDCIRRIRTGRGASSSEYVVVQPPTPEMFEAEFGDREQRISDAMRGKQR